MLRSFATAMPVVAVLTPIVVTTAVMTAAMVSLSLRVMAFLLDESGAKSVGGKACGIVRQIGKCPTVPKGLSRPW